MPVSGNKTVDVKALLDRDPAVKPYFMNSGFEQLRDVIRDSFENCFLAASQRANAFKHMPPAGSVIKKALVAIRAIFDTAAAAAILVFGMAVCIVFCLVMSVVYLVAIGGFSVARVAVAAREGSYRRSHHLEFVCDSCKNEFSYPGYVCPSCGAIHGSLYPNTLGILTHRCTCGQRLPSTFSSKVRLEDGTEVRRRDLEQACPNRDCHQHAAAGEYAHDAISIVGGRSAGKTCFIAAVSHQLVEEVLPANGYAVDKSMWSDSSKQVYQELQRGYIAGDIELTTEGGGDANTPSAFAFSFGISGNGMNPDRQVHLYDIAGETFMRGEERESQSQYGYDKGYVLMVDPFSLEYVQDELGDQLHDQERTSNVDPAEALTALIHKAQHAQGLEDSDQLGTPLAVVLGKADEVRLEDRFGEDAQLAYIASHPDVAATDAEDALVRQFFKSNGMGKLVVMADTYFANNRFFVVSALGHARGRGAFQPRGALEPIRWIAELTDADFARAIA